MNYYYPARCRGQRREPFKHFSSHFSTHIIYYISILRADYFFALIICKLYDSTTTISRVLIEWYQVNWNFYITLLRGGRRFFFNSINAWKMIRNKNNHEWRVVNSWNHSEFFPRLFFVLYVHSIDNNECRRACLV